MSTEAGERALLSMRPVRISLLKYYALMIFFVAAAIFLWMKPDIIPDWKVPMLGWTVVDAMKVLFIFIALLSVLTGEIRRIFKEYIVTTLRVIDSFGIVRKQTTFMMTNKIERVYTSQTMFQRLLRYGDVVVDTGDDQVTLASVAHPREVEAAITQAMASSRR